MSIRCWGAAPGCNEAPSAAISTTLTTGLSSPRGIALDPVATSTWRMAATMRTSSPPACLSIRRESNANAAPIATISGGNTGLIGPGGIALDSSGNIYVADNGCCEGDYSVVCLSGAGSSTGLLNEFPIAYILFAANISAEYLQGIALDSSGKIYVADDGPFDAGPGSVLVFPALGPTAGGNVAPVATISGSNTGLSVPYGIVVDSSGNIYVADAGTASVFTYPALGSSTGLLNEFPIATISGPLTELGYSQSPQFIAIQPVVAPTPTPTATATATATGTPTPVTTLKAAPATLKFGIVDATGTSKPKKVTLTNKGAVAAQNLGRDRDHSLQRWRQRDLRLRQEYRAEEDLRVRRRVLTGDGRESDRRGDRRGLQRCESHGGSVRHRHRGDTQGAQVGVVHGGKGGQRRQVEEHPVLESWHRPGNTGRGCSGRYPIPVPAGTADRRVHQDIRRTPRAGRPNASSGSRSRRLWARAGSTTATLSVAYTYGANSGSVSTALKSKVK